MHHFIFPKKSTWISSGSSTVDGTSFTDQNFGQDQILELKKEYFNSTFNYQTRLLLQFDLTDISNSMDRSITTTRTQDIKNPKFYIYQELQMYLPLYMFLHVHHKSTLPYALHDHYL